jgi:hypothetical protein
VTLAGATPKIEAISVVFANPPSSVRLKIVFRYCSTISFDIE